MAQDKSIHEACGMPWKDHRYEGQADFAASVCPREILSLSHAAEPSRQAVDEWFTGLRRSSFRSLTHAHCDKCDRPAVVLPNSTNAENEWKYYHFRGDCVKADSEPETPTGKPLKSCNAHKLVWEDDGECPMCFPQFHGCCINSPHRGECGPVSLPQGKGVDMKQPELQLLIIDLGDSCVVKVEKGDRMDLVYCVKGGSFRCTKGNIVIHDSPFTDIRAAIDSLADTSKPVPRIERDGNGYRIYEDAGSPWEDLPSDTYGALSELAGKPLPVWTPRKGEWTELTNFGDGEKSCGYVWRYTLSSQNGRVIGRIIFGASYEHERHRTSKLPMAAPELLAANGDSNGRLGRSGFSIGENLMSHGIFKIRDRYFEWSTVVDAPVTYGMTLEELEAYIKDEYGRTGLKELPARMDRVEKYGTSYYPPKTVDELLVLNRAGDNEEGLTADEIYVKYNSQPMQHTAVIIDDIDPNLTPPEPPPSS